METQAIQLPERNPDFIYITCKYLINYEGFQEGEPVRPVFQQIDKRDSNGLDIWVLSRNSRHARPIFLIPAQYSLTPIKQNNEVQNTK